MTNQYQDGAKTILPIHKTSTGTPVRFTVPQNTLYEVLGIRLKFTADANVATRSLTIRFLDKNDNIILIVESDQTVTAGQTKSFNCAPGLPNFVGASGNEFHVPLPEGLFLNEKMDILLNINSIQAGDISDAYLIAREYLVGEHS